MDTEGQKPAKEIQLLSPLAELRVGSLGEIRAQQRTKAIRVEATGVWGTAAKRAETFLLCLLLLFNWAFVPARSGTRAEVRGQL